MEAQPNPAKLNGGLCIISHTDLELPPLLFASGDPTTLTAKPQLQIPGDQRLTSSFASELGVHLKNAGIYRLHGKPVTENAQRTGFEPITPIKFVTWIENHVLCYRMKQDHPVERSISTIDAAKVLQSEQFANQLLPVKRLNSVPLPVFRANGKLELLLPGYDQETQILTAGSISPYDLNLSLDTARTRLESLLVEFPFANSERGKAGVVAAMLTVYGLHLLSPTCLVPAFIYTANDAGCGKGLCVMLAVVPVLGFLPTGIQPPTEQEMEKVLFATARSGEQVLFLDNIDRLLSSASLESFLTASHICGRLLGQSNVETCLKKTVVLISGNNCTTRADMRRRSIFIEFFIEELHAEHRLIRNPLYEAAILARRSDILAALYALVRSWAEAGRPKPGRVLQGFVEWSEVIAGIVEHAGFACPVPPPMQNATPDVELADTISLVQRLHDYNVPSGVPFRDLVRICQLNSLFMDKLPSYGEPNRQSKTAFSRLLKRYDRRIFPGSLRFRAVGEGHARRYLVETTNVDKLTINDRTPPAA